MPQSAQKGCLGLKGKVEQRNTGNIVDPNIQERKRLRCPRCERWNADTANFCSHCGAPLPEGDKPGGVGKGFPVRRVAVLGALVVLAAFLALWRLSPHPPGPGFSRSPALSNGDHSLKRAEPQVSTSPAPETPSLVVGEVSVAHHLGLELARIPAVVISGHWIALPVSACYGGDRWWFSTTGGRSFEIDRGLWRDGDPLALWRLEEQADLPGPDLGSWQAGVPLVWRSVVTNARRGVPDVEVVGRSERLAFVREAGIPQEPGVYQQDGQVVGWTFGPALEIGVLWTGPAGRRLSSDIRVDHFYNLTFSNGREEQFIRALTMGDDSPARERLRAFAEGFRLRPELPLNHTPSVLRPDRISVRMKKLAADLLQKGFAREVADRLDLEALRSAGDVDLAVLFLRGTVQYYGKPAAVDVAEDMLENPGSLRGFDFHRLQGYVKALCMDWIRDSIGLDHPPPARRAYRRVENLFPDDLEIRLLGVEIALKDEDWRTAQALLPVTAPVSPELAARAARLAGRAKQLKAEEGKIVIRFEPGRRRIPIRATLNHRVEQEFVIDTGASMVTIPSNTAGTLGLGVEDDTPKRWVSTAGGPVLAREITLASIELKGRTVNEVRAWVLDIPGHPEIGLLGLNYLNRFQVEIDNEEGVLMLKPR